jgi:hypothetical protein
MAAALQPKLLSLGAIGFPSERRSIELEDAILGEPIDNSFDVPRHEARLDVAHERTRFSIACGHRLFPEFTD